MLLAKIQVRWKYLENKMGPRQPPQLQDVPSRKWVFAAQPVGLGRLLRTEALLPAQSRGPQSLQRLRGLRPAFLLARAFAQPVGLGRLLRTEAPLPAQRRVLQCLQLLRGFRSAFLLARAFAQPVGLDQSLRTEAPLPAQRRVLQCLQLLRQLNRLSPQGPAQSPSVPCDPLPRFDKLGLVRLSLSNPPNYQKRGAIALNARPSAASKASTPLIVTKPGGAQRKNHYPKQCPFPRAMWWVC